MVYTWKYCWQIQKQLYNRGFMINFNYEKNPRHRQDFSFNSWLMRLGVVVSHMVAIAPHLWRMIRHLWPLRRFIRLLAPGKFPARRLFLATKSIVLYDGCARLLIIIFFLFFIDFFLDIYFPLFIIYYLFY